MSKPDLRIEVLVLTTNADYNTSYYSKYNSILFPLDLRGI